MSCYVEKPVGRCAAETKELSEIFDRAGLPFYTAYISRAYERTQSVRKLMRDGVIGDQLEKVVYILRGTGGARDLITRGSIPWRLDASQSGGGLITDVGCHVIDRIDYLCGPLEQVKGTAEHRSKSKNSEVTVLVEDYCRATATVGAAQWASIPNGGCEGATVDLTWDFSCNDDSDDAEPIDELQFIGSNGRTLKMAGMSPNGPIQVLDKDGSTVMETLTFDTPEHTAQRLIQAVTNDLLDREKLQDQDLNQPIGVDYLSFGDNAIRTQRVIDTMLNSYYGGREIGYWSRTDSWPGRPVDK
ncbi:MAG: putative dehydrogenase [Bacillariaceae sp.]